MSALGRAIADVKFRIPPQIINLVFTERQAYYRAAPTSVDNNILNLVVRPRVLVDCNLIGGTEVLIGLDGLQTDRPNDYSSVYRIPKEKTQGRSINSVLDVTFADPTKMSSYGVGASCQNSPAMQAVQGVMDALGTIPITSTANVELIAENTVLVRDSIVMPANSFLRCILANDDNLSNLQLRSYLPFVKMVELAVKSYIFNTYIVDLDIGQLQGGHNIGRIKDVIDGYADAEELYQIHIREVMHKVFLMNSQESWKRYLKMNVGGLR